MWYNALTMLPATGRPAASWVHYTTSCHSQSSAPEDGQNNCPKHVELTGIINKPLLLQRFCSLYYLYQWCTVKQISDNEIYLLMKYIKSFLWRVAKLLSYIQDARCLRVKRIETCHITTPSTANPSRNALETNSSLHGDRADLCYDLRKTMVELVYLSGRRSLSLLLLRTLKMTYVHRKFRGMLLGNR